MKRKLLIIILFLLFANQLAVAETSLPDNFEADFNRLFLSTEPLRFQDNIALLDKIEAAIPNLSQDEQDLVRGKSRRYLLVSQPGEFAISRVYAPDCLQTGVAAPVAFLRLTAVDMLGKIGNEDDADFINNLDKNKNFNHPYFEEICKKAVNYIQTKQDLAHQPLELTIKSDEDVYEAGEDIFINYQIKNDGKEAIIIAPPFEDNGVIDPNGFGASFLINKLGTDKIKMEILPLADFLSVPISPDKVITIPSGGSYSKRVNIVRIDNESILRDIKYSSTEILQRSGEFSVAAKYEWTELRKAYPMPNCWHGTITSNAITIEVKEKRDKPSVAEAEKLVLKDILKDSPNMNPSVKVFLKELTTPELWERMVAQVFKVKEEAIPLSNDTYLIKDREVIYLASGWGCCGLISMCVTDLDKNNQPELLYTHSGGSGIHRTNLAIYLENDGKPQIIRSDHAYFDVDLFLKKIDDQKVIVEIGKFKDYEKAIYLPIATLGNIVLESKGAEPELLIQFDEKLPEKVKEQFR
ncbi:MAG: hypothetical protein NTV06_04110 [candidate division Zixibacteria bacterium]|nr:hypothetical protein [candidate division Zixibacteria bacterium]